MNSLFRISAIAVALALSACRPSARLSSEAYVWQQVRSDAVDAAIERGSRDLDAFYLHAADVTFATDRSTIRRFDLPWRAVAKTEKPVGIVIRIPEARGKSGLSPDRAGEIASLARSIIAEARAEGITCREVQIDYDCPDSRLSTYAAFLLKLKSLCPGNRIVFTALPSWLRESDFGKLAASADSYVLQVHSLELPATNDSTAVICDVEKARQAISRASRFGVPFRAALSTYQCVVLLNADGKRLGVISEGGIPVIPPGTVIIPGYSDPTQLARLVADLKTSHSPLLTGIIWYRLPVDTDRMNWPWITFQAVSSGRQPKSRLEVSLQPQPEGFSTIELKNLGERPEHRPSRITVRYNSAAPESADALAGYRLMSPPSHALIFQDTVPFSPGIVPGKSLTIGWLRASSLDGVHILLSSP
ncbi:hypothetical protein DB345_15305 [Spartobacteria bacterium LR76]|nr:hypothetical protein DB345_15305 [Spartobacteria bacterium LR76]